MIVNSRNLIFQAQMVITNFHMLLSDSQVSLSHTSITENRKDHFKTQTTFVMASMP